MVVYSVKVKFIEERLEEFYRKLVDGTIANQKPDGQEIVSSMKRVKITVPKTIQWSEMCFCDPPLKHERVTVYDQFLTDLETNPVDDYIEVKGKLFFDFLERQFKK